MMLKLVDTCVGRQRLYGIWYASATTELIRSVFHDEKVLPCSCYLDGQYGETGVFASTPAVIGKDGIEDVLELQMTEDDWLYLKILCGY